eukprot:3777614-Rhodomonas_salina.1
MIGDEGAGRLARVLGECTALESLVLSENNIGDEGVGKLAAALAEWHGEALEQVDLPENNIGQEAAKS